MARQLNPCWRILDHLASMKHLAWPAELLSLRSGVENTSLDPFSDKAHARIRLSCPLEVSPQKGKRADTVNGMRAVEELDFGAVRNAQPGIETANFGVLI